MCGIITILEKEQKEFDTVLNLIDEGWKKFIKHRGEDSYGYIIYGIDKNTKKDVLKYYKELDIKKVLKKLKKDLNKLSKLHWIIAHNRATSVGGINVELAHPIVIDNGDILVIHNGTNRKLLDYVDGLYKVKHLSDTKAIGLLWKTLTSLSIKDEKLLTKNRTLFYNLLSDETGVVFVVDKRRDLIVFHKDSMRSLYVNEDLDVLASEPITAGKWSKVEDINLLLTTFKHLNRDIVRKYLLPVKPKFENFIYDTCIYCNELFIRGEKEYKYSCKSCSKYYTRTTYYGSYYSYSKTDTTTTNKKTTEIELTEEMKKARKNVINKLKTALTDILDLYYLPNIKVNKEFMEELGKYKYGYEIMEYLKNNYNVDLDLNSALVIKVISKLYNEYVNKYVNENIAEIDIIDTLPLNGLFEDFIESARNEYDFKYSYERELDEIETLLHEYNKIAE